MKKILHISYFIFHIFILTGCQDVIDLKTEVGPTQLVVDGWITNQQGQQLIKLTQSAGYFDNAAPIPAKGANVSVTDETGKIYTFTDLKNDGNYIWKPTNTTEALGHINGKYKLSISYKNENYTAQTSINRVPTIDSLAYEFRTQSIAPSAQDLKEGYMAEFYANDFKGEGDCYWVKHYRKGVLQNNPQELIVAYDGTFSAGANFDGFMFIRPIRQSISGRGGRKFYAANDTVKVELHSITKECFYFLFQIRQEAANQGLFAIPISNIISNVVNTTNSSNKALGFFGGSAVSKYSTIIDPKKARPSTK
jgi:Domain of unknown function (DUF4249)